VVSGPCRDFTHALVLSIFGDLGAAISEASVPQGGEDQAIRAALDELLRWPELARSPQLARFLRYVVDAKLAGNAQAIKAYAIAVDVLGRPADFDPQSDPIVRVQARRLRALLDRFYLSSAAHGPIRIRLPVGRYVPEFEPFVPQRRASDAATELPTPAPSPPAAGGGKRRKVRRGRVAAVFGSPMSWVALLVLVLGLTAFEVISRLALPAGAPLPREPLIAVLPFVNTTGDPGLDGMADALAATLRRDLAAFPDVAVVDAGAADPAPAAIAVGGRLALGSGGLDIVAMLTRPGGDAPVWTTEIGGTSLDANIGAAAAGVARLIAGRLAAYRGPIQEPGRAWLLRQARLEEAPSRYTCLLRLRQAGENEQLLESGVVTECFDRVLKRDPKDPVSQAARSWVSILNLERLAAKPASQPEFAAAAARIGQAAAVAPRNAFVQSLEARALAAGRQYDAALPLFVSTLALDPADLDVRAAYGIALAGSGNWAQAAVEARDALTSAPFPPPWYFQVPMLDAYRQGRWNAAIAAAQSYSPANRRLAAALAVAAGVRAKRDAVVEQYLGAVLSDPQFKASGILARLADTVTSPGLLAAIGDGLTLAGIPQADMRHPF
jgi:tetratricopeptide (TPR) repeat protein